VFLSGSLVVVLIIYLVLHTAPKYHQRPEWHPDWHPNDRGAALSQHLSHMSSWLKSIEAGLNRGSSDPQSTADGSSQTAVTGSEADLVIAEPDAAPWDRASAPETDAVTSAVMMDQAARAEEAAKGGVIEGSSAITKVAAGFSILSEGDAAAAERAATSEEKAIIKAQRDIAAERDHSNQRIAMGEQTAEQSVKVEKVSEAEFQEEEGILHSEQAASEGMSESEHPPDKFQVVKMASQPLSAAATSKAAEEVAAADLQTAEDAASQLKASELSSLAVAGKQAGVIRAEEEAMEVSAATDEDGAAMQEAAALRAEESDVKEAAVEEVIKREAAVDGGDVLEVAMEASAVEEAAVEEEAAEGKADAEQAAAGDALLADVDEVATLWVAAEDDSQPKPKDSPEHSLPFR